MSRIASKVGTDQGGGAINCSYVREITQAYGVYNYVDTPDFDMNPLVKKVQYTLRGHERIGPRLPYWLGIILGYVADGVAIISGRNLPVSSIRVKKFCSTTAFSTSKSNLNNFIAPFSLDEGLTRTLYSEFISPDPDREIFYTE